MAFFEFIQKAAIEKTHSAMISWIFSANCHAISELDKIDILAEITEEKFDKDDRVLSTITEYNYIDILIITTKCVIAIENKIKIREHDNQLIKYDEVLKSCYENKKHFKIYLDIIGEKINKTGWKSITYKDLLKAISSKEKCDEIDYYFLQDYMDNIKKMTS